MGQSQDQRRAVWVGDCLGAPLLSQETLQPSQMKRTSLSWYSVYHLGWGVERGVPNNFRGDPEA